MIEIYIAISTAVVSSLISIYLLLTRQKDFFKIEDELISSTDSILKNIENEMEHQFEVFQHTIIDNLKDAQKYQTDITKNFQIINELKERLENQDKIISEQKATIYRKSNQIKRLQNDK